ncbi:hypothetical protein DFA_09641 [Cavenderia fasciculata]|uniref:ComC supersandwich domain-containing protein n=1 Tax=Cavenderia fasciculata TaxID=261658 RepID=F4Q870_CACFS|nr:uncharacterized protein DFA_09641 [Cavenderia fasciculata]EGG15970.1 hypothetical protein DFA_09641 [Cavenderia fasciculata]|eukprot:XP_004352295.1 hypothetical protein DFA_09641 [Cavenderia fasciculata]
MDVGSCPTDHLQATHHEYSYYFCSKYNYTLFQGIKSASNTVILKINAQPIPDAELKSVVWLVRHTGLTVRETQEDICSMTSMFTCTPEPSNLYTHITKINIEVTAFNATSLSPGYLGITSFQFPELRSMSLIFKNNVSFIGTTSTLDMLDISPLKILKSISIIDDGSISSIPSSFGTNMPLLVSLELKGCPNIVNVRSLGNASELRSVELSGTRTLARLDVFTIKANVYPAILSINLEVNISTAGISYSLGALGNLTELVFKQNGVSVLSLALDNRYLSTIQLFGNVSATPSHPKELGFLELFSAGATVAPFDFDTYPNLETLSIYDHQFTTLPFTSSYRKLRYLTIQRGLTTIPPISIELPMASINFANNNLTGTLSNDIIPSGRSSLLFDVSDNPHLSGSLDSRFCQLRTFIANTSINSVPDCFNCYYDKQLGFSANSPPAVGFKCQITFNQLVFGSKNGIAEITGSNFGWKDGSNYSIITPNTKVAIDFLGSGAPQTVGLEFGDLHYKEFQVVDATIIVTASSFEPLTRTFTFKLTYNTFLPHYVTLQSSSMFEFPCTVLSSSSTTNTLLCQVDQLNPGTFTATIKNDYNINKVTITAPGTQLIYPLVTSVQMIGNLSLAVYGYFGESIDVYYAWVTLNGTLQCPVTSKNQTTILCTLLSAPQPGQASVQAKIEDFFSAVNTIFYPFPPSIDLKQKCIEDTLNCYGHGQCSDQGICVCDQNYYDNCRYFKNPNVTFVQNDTKPVATFELDGYKFFFSLVAIQELDVDDNVVQELLINSTLYPTLSSIVNVTSLIEYSTQDRQLPFGDSIVSVGANSIKVGVNVTGWQYQSILSHLRVVFSTIVNNEQSTIQSCSSSDIPTFEQILGSDSYLRVIKNDTQFYGRFLSYSYSDGRKTFSRNELINQTNIIGNNNNESLALIGVHVPQCTFCLLDPDFSALVVNNEKVDCSSPSSSNMWKIIVGCVVGGAVFIALVIALVFYLRDSNSTRLKIKAAKNLFGAK